MVVSYFVINHGARVTSPWGMRLHPITGVEHMHHGIDFGGVKRGHVWTSPFDGTVTHVHHYNARGITVVTTIKGTNELQLFQHFDKALVKVGDKIKKGDPVGTNGTTGDVTGPHLHYEIRINNGSALGLPWGDPAKYTGGETMDYYIVQPNDGLWGIADKHGISREDIVKWNKEEYPSIVNNPGLIQVGWKLRVTPPALKPEEQLKDLEKRVKTLEQIIEGFRGVLG